MHTPAMLAWEASRAEPRDDPEADELEEFIERVLGAMPDNLAAALADLVFDGHPAVMAALRADRAAEIGEKK